MEALFMIMNAELQTLRGRTFFWVGLGVLPVFWLWWMTPRQFTERQRFFARLWTAVYAVAVALSLCLWPAAQEQAVMIRDGYAQLMFLVGGALWAWLLFRKGSPLWNLTLIDGFFMFVTFGHLIPIMLNAWLKVGLAPIKGPLSILCVLIPACLHLLVIPTGRVMDRIRGRCRAWRRRWGI